MIRGAMDHRQRGRSPVGSLGKGAAASLSCIPADRRPRDIASVMDSTGSQALSLDQFRRVIARCDDFERRCSPGRAPVRRGIPHGVCGGGRVGIAAQPRGD